MVVLSESYTELAFVKGLKSLHKFTSQILATLRSYIEKSEHFSTDIQDLYDKPLDNDLKILQDQSAKTLRSMINSVSRRNEALQSQWEEMKEVDKELQAIIQKIKDYQKEVNNYYAELHHKHQSLYEDYKDKREQLIQIRESLIGQMYISETRCMVKSAKNQFEKLLKDYHAFNNEVVVSELTLEIGKHQQEHIFTDLFEQLQVYRNALMAKWNTNLDKFCSTLDSPFFSNQEIFIRQDTNENENSYDTDSVQNSAGDDTSTIRSDQSPRLGKNDKLVYVQAEPTSNLRLTNVNTNTEGLEYWNKKKLEKEFPSTENSDSLYDDYKLTARYFNKHIYDPIISPRQEESPYWNRQDLVLAIQRSQEANRLGVKIISLLSSLSINDFTLSSLKELCADMRKKTLEVAYPEVIYFDKFADLRDYMITATIKKLDDIKAELSEPDFGANGSLQSILNYETELKIHLEKSKVKHYEEICDLIEDKINNVEEPKAILFYESDVIKAWEDLHSREKRFLSDQSVKACPELPEVIRKPYFWGNIQENEVAELGRLNDGKYLIKWSDTAQGKKQNEYVTNLRLYLTPGRISTFTKFVIYGNETKGYWIVKKPTTYFPTVQELIEHYSKGGGTLTEKNLSLISPIDNYHRAVCEHYCLTKKSGYFIREGLYRKEKEQTHVAVTEVTKHSSEDLMSEFRAIRLNTRQDNLIQVLDILVTDYQFKIISEFKKGIKLSEYLREQKDQLGNLELLDISKQVANGLSHLHKLKCIHGRLKARSCLFNIDTKLVKITGFGTYKFMSKQELESIKELRWISPEVLLDNEFSVESDRWSFGITWWEIFNFGTLPYYHYKDDTQKIQREIAAKKFPERTDRMNKNYYEFVQLCCDKHKENRITIQAIVNSLQNCDPDAPNFAITQFKF